MTLRLTYNSDRTRDQPEVCVYCHEVFRRPAAYITHQYKRHFRETDEIKVTFTRAIVQRLRDESETELNMALQTRPANDLSSKCPGPSAASVTTSLGPGELPRSQGSAPDTQSQPGTQATGIGMPLQDKCNRRRLPDPSRTVSASPVAPGKRAWLASDPYESQAGSAVKKECLEKHRKDSALLTNPSSDRGVGLAARSGQESARDETLSELRIDQRHHGSSERDTRSSSCSGQNDLINRVTKATIHSFPFTVEGKTTTLKEEISRAILAEHPEKEKVLQELLQELTPQDIEDLHRTMFDEGVGLDRRDLQAVWEKTWDLLQGSRTFILEKELQLRRSSCMFVDIDREGDWVVCVKVGRLEGLKLIADWCVLTHFRYMS